MYRGKKLRHFSGLGRAFCESVELVIRTQLLSSIDEFIKEVSRTNNKVQERNLGSSGVLTVV